jgi:hypothetical protein
MNANSYNTAINGGAIAKRRQTGSQTRRLNFWRVFRENDKP